MNDHLPEKGSPRFVALLAAAKAHDTEEASQKGEPSPWSIPEAASDEVWQAERVAAISVALEAFENATLPINGDHISLWMPEQDPITLAVLGKLIEECNELSGAAARCIIQGCDQLDPDTGRTNLTELEREAADVYACLQVVAEKLGITHSLTRQIKKVAGFYRWHRLIEEAAQP
jgi:hypothetical protein